MTHLYISPKLNAAGLMTHLEIQGSPDHLICWTADIFPEEGRSVDQQNAGVNCCDITVIVHWRRFTQLVLTPHNISVRAVSSSRFNVNCLFLYVFISVNISPNFRGVKYRSGRCPSRPLCICPRIYMPVCGVDKRTYSNACTAGCAWVWFYFHTVCSGLHTF